MKRNPWWIALVAATLLGLAASIGGAVALVQALPHDNSEAGYAGIDWGWVNIVEVLWLPGATTLLFAGGIGVLVVLAVLWRTERGSAAQTAERTLT